MTISNTECSHPDAALEACLDCPFDHDRCSACGAYMAPAEPPASCCADGVCSC